MALPTILPTISEVADKTLQVFGVRPCLLQIKVCLAFLQGDKNIVVSAATGFGKTLTFFMPLLFKLQGIIIIATALNILGKQNVEQLSAAGIRAIFVGGGNSSPQVFKDIKAGKYRVIVTNPELLMKPGGSFEKLWDDKEFVSKLMGFVCDEAHCISKWGSFRPEYKLIGRLRYFHPRKVVYAASATLSKAVLDDVCGVLRLRKDNTLFLHRSNDRSNVFLSVQRIRHAANTFKDLQFLVPDGWKDGDPSPPKFLIFFDNIKEAESAAKFLRNRLPLSLQYKIKWFHATMSDAFREDEVEAIRRGDTWGLCVTDSFGMGIDIPDFKLVIQWRVTCSMDSLTQRFGRAARDPRLEGFALLFAEAKYFDEERKQREAKRLKRQGKRKQQGNAGADQPNKRAKATEALQSGSAAVRQAPNEASAEHGDGNFEDGPDRGSDEEQSEPEDIDEELRTKYNADVDTVKPIRKKKDDDIEPAMDDFVNADSRQGLHCRRKVPRLFFHVAQLVIDHLECRPDLPTGCTRCGPKTSRLCCDICNPREFKAFIDYIMSGTLSTQSSPSMGRMSTIRKYEPTPTDVTLKTQLYEWRDQTAKESLPAAYIIDFGPNIFLSDEVLDRIVDCAHASKIASISDIQRETKSSTAMEHGEAILSIVRSVRPPPPSLYSSTPLRMPLQSRATELNQGPDSNGNAKPPRRPTTCSACGEVGHNSRNKECPKKAPGVTPVQDENLPVGASVPAPEGSQFFVCGENS